MSDMYLESGNIEKFPKKHILWIMIKLTSWQRLKDVALQMSLLGVFRTFLGRLS